MTRSLSSATAAVALGLALVAAACSVSGSHASSSGTATGTSTTGGGTPGAGPATTVKGGSTSLRWSSCDGNFQCATLRVPVDYAKPDGQQLTLAMARRPAADPAERIGSLFINPGGPGGSAIETIEQIPLPSTLTDHFDIVGFDPRGVGRSSPLNCHSHLQEMYDTDPVLDTPAEKAAYLQVSHEFVDECARKYKAILPFLGTQNVARDMDRVRAAVGDRKLTYLGYSYGTSIGQQYAQLFPTHIRAMVLDGVVDEDESGLQAAGEQAGGFELALKAFLANCQASSECPIHSNPKQILDEDLATATKTPIPAPDADRPAGRGVMELGVGQALYAKELWPQLAQALADAHDGDGSGMVELADEYLQRDSNGTYPNGFEIYFAVSCLDSTWPRDPNAVFAYAKKIGKEDPELGEGLVNDYVRCAIWPVKPEPLPKATAVGSPPILVISTTRDPATPYASGVKVAKQLQHGVLLTNDGDGHTAFGQGKACVDDAVSTYFVTLKPPENGLECK